MALWTALGLGAGAAVAATGVAVVGAVAYYVILPQFVEPGKDTTSFVQEAVVETVEDAEDPPAIVEAGEAPTAETEAETAEVEDAPAAPEAPPAPRVPTFDVVRVDAMGSALVAGIADANKVVDVLLDGNSVSETQSGGDGRFVAMFDIPPSTEPRTMQLSVRLEDDKLFSEQTILIAPFQLPVAAVEPEVAPEPDAPVASSGTATVTEPDAPIEDTAQEASETQVVTAPQPAPEPEPVEPASSETVAAVEPEPETPAVQPETTVADIDAPAAEETAEVVIATPVEDATNTEIAVATAPAPRPEPVAAVAEATTEAEEATAEAIQENASGPEAPDLPDVIIEAQSPAAPPLVIASSEGIQVLQPSRAPVISTTSSPQLRVNVTIDTISYDLEGAVEIAGRGQGGGFARIYLDNLVRETVAVSTQGLWSARMTDIEPGIYTLRIDELDANGTVTSRFETPFKREEPEILAAAQAAMAQPEPVSETPNAPVEEPVAVVTPAPEVSSTPEPEAPVEPVAENETPIVPNVTEAEAQAATEAPAAPEPATRPRVVVVTVQPGFTLWGIAQDMMGEGEMYVQVYEANKEQIRNPDLIYPGQVFTVPEHLE